MPAPFAAGAHRAKLATVTTTLAAGALDDQAPFHAREALAWADGFEPDSKALAAH
jgi:hypothetical protein